MKGKSLKKHLHYLRREHPEWTFKRLRVKGRWRDQIDAKHLSNGRQISLLNASDLSVERALTMFARFGWH